MTYNDWRDELKNNLLNVPEAERRRVLDYYAEAYADRRAAGFSEHEIIEGFGAPYDAAQAILDENYEEAPRGRKSEKTAYNYEKNNYRREPQPAKTETTENARKDEAKKESDGVSNAIWVLLCIVLIVPFFGLIIAAAGVTVGLVAGPILLAVSGVGVAIGGFTSMISGLSVLGLDSVGIGLILLGIAVILEPVGIMLAKLIWKIFRFVVNTLKKLVKGESK